MNATDNPSEWRNQIHGVVHDAGRLRGIDQDVDALTLGDLHDLCGNVDLAAVDAEILESPSGSLAEPYNAGMTVAPFGLAQSSIGYLIRSNKLRTIHL